MKEKLISLICARFTITETDLLGRSKYGTIGEARQAFVLIAFNNITRNKSQIARWLNRKSHNSTTEILSNAEDNYQFDKVFRRHIDTITADINL